LIRVCEPWKNSVHFLAIIFSISFPPYFSFEVFSWQLRVCELEVYPLLEALYEGQHYHLRNLIKSQEKWGIKFQEPFFSEFPTGKCAKWRKKTVRKYLF
jgi:hypothetical protein